MRRTLLAFNVALVVLLGAAYLFMGRVDASRSPPTPATVEIAPPFELRVLAWDGGTVRLGDFAGRPVILNFWASWCEACKEERSELVELRQKVAASVLGIATADDGADVRAAEERAPHPFPVALDETDAVASAYGVAGLPTTIVVSGEGRVLKRVSRSLRATDVQEIVTLLGSRGAVASSPAETEAHR